MDPDIALVIGVVLLALAIPSLLSAFSESRTPRTAVVLAVIAAVAVYWAVTNRPGGYALADIPEAFVRVVGMVVH